MKSFQINMLLINDKLSYTILVFWFFNILPLHCELYTSYDPKDWPQHIIGFSAEGTLKDIFDAGIRP